MDNNLGYLVPLLKGIQMKSSRRKVTRKSVVGNTGKKEQKNEKK